ncbi:MAG: response regulator [Mucilaginibacter polytrichastri]|nr:response regulator [Mucilaginibacter polytrichastri]
MENILVIEDDDLMRKVLERILRSQGYQVQTAFDGRDALKKIGGSVTPYDLIITEPLRPDTDDFAAVGKAKNIGRPAAVMVISNRVDADTTESGSKLGASEYMQKPVMPREFLSAVKRALSTRTAA